MCDKFFTILLTGSPLGKTFCQVGTKMNQQNDRADIRSVEVMNAQAASSIVLVCEHASSHVPAQFGDLGLSDAALNSHIAWDPGALSLATKLADHLDAVLIASNVSRLIYDCNRQPEAADAMPARSEVFDIPGNSKLSTSDKAARVARYYTPFRDAVAKTLAAKTTPVLITIHSFTPIYHNVPRDVEIGVLHDADSRLADALLARARQLPHKVARNEPYGPDHGVTHTLRSHALPGGHLNVMLEVRNDLIADEVAQTGMAEKLAPWIAEALTSLGAGA